MIITTSPERTPSTPTFAPVPATAAVGDAYLAFPELRATRRERRLVRIAGVLACIAPVAIAASLLAR
jgi:hypothetical protein